VKYVGDSPTKTKKSWQYCSMQTFFCEDIRFFRPGPGNGGNGRMEGHDFRLHELVFSKSNNNCSSCSSLNIFHTVPPFLQCLDEGGVKKYQKSFFPLQKEQMRFLILDQMGSLIMSSVLLFLLCSGTVHAADASATPTSTMTWQGWFCLAIVLLVIIGLYFDLISCTAMMFGTTLILMLATIIDSKQFVAGLSNSGVVTIAHLFIVVDPISKLPMVKHLVTRVLEMGSHTNIFFIRMKLCVLAMVLSPFTNQNPLVVMLTPIVKSYCSDRDIPHSQLLMPMAFASAFGGSWTVIGTSVNLVYDGLMVNAKMGHMAFFELIKTAIIPSIVGLIYLVFVPSLVLPSATGSSFKLAWKQSSNFLAQFCVQPTSPLVGTKAGILKERMPPTLRNSVDLIELSRDNDHVVHAPPRPDDVFHAGDLVVFSGPVATLMSYAKILHLEWVPHEEAHPTFNKPNEPQAEVTENSLPPENEMTDVTMAGDGSPTKTRTPHRRPSGLAVRRGLTKSFRQPPSTSVVATTATADEFSSTPATGHQSHHPEFLEVILDFRSQAIGTTVGSAFFRSRYNATVLAVRPVSGMKVIGTSRLLHQHVLQQGDTLLVYGDPSFLVTFQSEFALVVQDKKEAEQSTKDISKNYIVVPDWFPFGTTVGKSDVTDKDEPDAAGGHGSGPSIASGMKLIRLPEYYPYLSVLIFVGMVAFTIAGFEIFVTSAIAVVVIVALKLMTVHEAVHAIDFNVMIQIAYSFGLGSGMSSSSLAGVIGNGLASAHVTGFKFNLLIAAIGSLVTCAITNKACAQVLFPIVISVQRGAQEDPLPAVMVLCCVSSWAFSTSYGKPSNLIIMAPGGYTGKDFAKLGLGLNIISIPVVAAAASLVYGKW
jgi:di/tricarboxylate transporter